MILRNDILSLSYLKKTSFTGGFCGMRYRLRREQEEGQEAQLGAVVWEAPYSFDATPKEQRQEVCFPFSEEGIQSAVDWMNQIWEEQKDRWIAAPNHW